MTIGWQGPKFKIFCPERSGPGASAPHQGRDAEDRALVPDAESPRKTMIMARNRCYLPETGHDHEAPGSVATPPRATASDGSHQPHRYTGQGMTRDFRHDQTLAPGLRRYRGAPAAGGATTWQAEAVRRGRGGGTRGGCCCRGGRCRRRRRAWRWPRYRRSCGRGGCRRAARSRSRLRPGSRCGRRA